MGYVLPPRPGGTVHRRSLRSFLRDVPGAESIRLWSVDVEVEVVPHHGRWHDSWEWRARILRNGRRNPGLFSQGGSWRRPGPSELRGRCRHQADAWIAGRAVVDEVRRRIAAVWDDANQSRAELVPL